MSNLGVIASDPVAVASEFVVDSRAVDAEIIRDLLLRHAVAVALNMIALFARQVRVAFGHGVFPLSLLEILPYAPAAFFYFLTLGG